MLRILKSKEEKLVDNIYSEYVNLVSQVEKEKKRFKVDSTQVLLSVVERLDSELAYLSEGLGLAVRGFLSTLDEPKMLKWIKKNYLKIPNSVVLFDFLKEHDSIYSDTVKMYSENGFLAMPIFSELYSKEFTDFKNAIKLYKVSVILKAKNSSFETRKNNFKYFLIANSLNGAFFTLSDYEKILEYLISNNVDDEMDLSKNLFLISKRSYWMGINNFILDSHYLEKNAWSSEKTLPNYDVDSSEYSKLFKNNEFLLTNKQKGV